MSLQFHALSPCTGQLLQKSSILESGENSVEYRVLLSYGPKLSIIVRADLATLPGNLLAVSLITQVNAADLRDTMHSAAERANRLVELIQLSVQQMVGVTFCNRICMLTLFVND